MNARKDSKSHTAGANSGKHRGSLLQFLAGAISALGLLGIGGTPASATPLSDRTTLEARVKTVRQALRLEAHRSGDIDQPQLAQWGNWGNWGNWYNGWNNWGNWYNG